MDKKGRVGGSGGGDKAHFKDGEGGGEGKGGERGI